MNDAEQQALLAQLRDVQLPAVSAWPAPGWWLLAALCVLLLVLFLLWLRRYRSRLWQREALSELQRIRSESQAQTTARSLSDCSRLCRRILLSVQGREQVAGLQGQAWLVALDRVTGRSLFAGGFGRLLEAGPYQREPEVAQHDLESLFDAIDELIQAAGRQSPEARSG